MTLVPVRRALLSVSDKTGLVEFAASLAAMGVELVSTGGTAAALRAAGLEVREVSELTGFPEILDGRVKTLHPAIHAGLLARRDDPAHAAALAAHGLGRFELLVASLYPFEAARAAGTRGAELVEQIDVGGPAMIRAAAKNHDQVAVVVASDDYEGVLAELRGAGGTCSAARARLAAKAFARTAAYDAAIADWLAAEAGEPFPERLTVPARLRYRLRYGENPQQRAAFYVTDPARPGLATAAQLQGKELSYNNLLDGDAALALVGEFTRPAVAIVKHANPCGVAEAETLQEAWAKALACDPVSAFGGIVALNGEVDEATAAALAGTFLEVVVATGFQPAAARRLARKEQLRLLATGHLRSGAGGSRLVRSINGGLLVQDPDGATLDPAALVRATARAPSEAELADLLFAWKVVKHVKSNAIVLARGGATVGIGMGQTSRVDAASLAVRHMTSGPGAGPCVVASDAFFPFPDGLLVAVEAGATAVIQPGGSMRDQAVIEAADERGVAMVLTGTRHFRH